MALPKTRQQFKERIMEDLGAPVLTVNLDEKQVENAIDDALSFWQDYHIDASRKEYIVHLVTQNDIDTLQIQLDPSIQSVVKIFRVNGNIDGYSVDELFNVNYQLRLSLWDLSSTNLTGYVIARQYIEMIDDLLVTDVMIRFRQTEHTLFLDTQKEGLVAGMFIVIEAWMALDPETVPDVWGNRVLRQLATAYARKRWAYNLIKFGNVAMPGGVTLDGQQMMAEAKEDIEKLEIEFIKKYQSIDPFYVY